MNAPEDVLTGPRALKKTGSPDWCWQTVDLLKRYMYSIEQTWRQADEVVADLEKVKAWKVIPPDHPYGSLNKLCEELLGMPARDVRRRIDREKIKALGPHGNGPGRGHKRDMTQNSFRESEYVVARLKRDDPVLAERVVNGEVTPYQAQREKGWKPPRIYVTSPERIAVSLRKYMSADDIAQLIAMLIHEEGGQ
jgi:hypothetical protein